MRSPPAARSRGAIGIAYACLAFACFSSADASAKFSSDAYSVGQILFMGSAIALPPTLLFCWRLEGAPSFRPKRLGLCLLRGALTALSVLAIVWSFTRLPLAEGYALLFTTPFLVAGLSSAFLGERVAARQWLAIVVGFIGVLVILRPGLSPIGLGHAAALGSAALFALALALLRKIGSEEKAGALLTTYFGACLVIYAPMLMGAWRTPEDGLGWSLMIAIGLFSSCGHIALVLAFRYAPAALLSPFQYSQMLWGLAFGAAFFGDLPDLLMLLGASIVIASGWALARASRADGEKPA